MMRLMEYLNEQMRPVPVSELLDLSAREFGVSEVTLRTDLAALCGLAGIRKLGRGVYATSGAAFGEERGPAAGAAPLFSTRILHHAGAKIAIAGAVCRILAGGEGPRVLLLDAGTTTYYLAERLAELDGMDVLVWTPSIAAASRLSGTPGISVRLLGGEFQPEYAVVSGDETARALRSLAGPQAEAAELGAPLPQFPGAHCVLDVNYISPDGHLFTDESKERLQKRLMADLAEDVTVVADHSKLFGRRLGLQAHEIYALRQLSRKRNVRVVTDAASGEDERRQLRGLLQEAFPGADIAVTEEAEAVVFTASGLDAGEPERGRPARIPAGRGKGLNTCAA